MKVVPAQGFCSVVPGASDIPGAPGAANTKEHVPPPPPPPPPPPVLPALEEKGVNLLANAILSAIPHERKDDRRLQNEQARQFKVHVDSLISQTLEDLRERLEVSYGEYFGLEQAETRLYEDPVNAAKLACAGPRSTSATDNMTKEAQAEGTGHNLEERCCETESFTSFEEKLDKERKTMLENSLKRGEDLEDDALVQHESSHHRFHWWLIDIDLNSDISPRSFFAEPVMAFIIISNAIVIGVRMDNPADPVFFFILDCITCLMFAIELFIHLRAQGWSYFTGKDRLFNIFNFILVCFDAVEIVYTLGRSKSFSNESGAPTSSIARMVRLMRITRILRVLRWEGFSDLLAMMQGMILGMPTLGWSMVLFVAVIYVFALIFREGLGRDDVENVTEMFNSVPRSIYTTFRCSFGDCSSTEEGLPIFEFVQLHYGWGWSLVYCAFSYTITVGLFNVISAIFVEATMKAAANLADRTKMARLQSPDVWSSEVTKLIRQLVRHHLPEPLSLVDCTYEEHCFRPLHERIEQERLKMADISDAEWAERLLVTDLDGKHLSSERVLAPSKAEFPIRAKLQPPKSFREIRDTGCVGKRHTRHNAIASVVKFGTQRSQNNNVDKYGPEEMRLSEESAEIAKLAYGARAIDKWVKDSEVMDSLGNLDIDPQDHDRLSDILDPQNDGQVPVLDLIDGLRRLRGFPRRSDIVCVDLMVRQSQRMHHKQVQHLENIERVIHELGVGIRDIRQEMQTHRSKPKTLTPSPTHHSCF